MPILACPAYTGFVFANCVIVTPHDRVLDWRVSRYHVSIDIPASVLINKAERQTVTNTALHYRHSRGHRWRVCQDRVTNSTQQHRFQAAYLLVRLLGLEQKSRQQVEFVVDGFPVARGIVYAQLGKRTTP